MAQPARPGGGFDMTRVSTGSKILLGAGVLLFIFMFFPWETASAFGFSANASGFSGGMGIFLALVLIAMLVWEGLLLAGVTINMGTTSPALISAILGGIVAVLAIIRFLVAMSRPEPIGIGWAAFIGLILALVIAYGAYVRYNESRVTTPPPAV